MNFSIPSNAIAFLLAGAGALFLATEGSFSTWWWALDLFFLVPTGLFAIGDLFSLGS